jgi:hypothetical protein
MKDNLKIYRSQKNSSIFEHSRTPFIQLLNSCGLPDIALNMERISQCVSETFGDSQITNTVHFVSQFFTECLKNEYEALENAYEDLLQESDKQPKSKPKECISPNH